MNAKEIAANLVPLEIQWITYAAEKGAYRTNEGGMGDTICSMLCSPNKESGRPALMKWEMGDKRGWDGSLLYTEKYTLNDLGLAVAKELEART